MRPTSPHSPPFPRRTAAFSLFEVLIAMGLMTVIMTAVLASFVQTRRLAAASVSQNCAVTIVQGYIEQLKNIPLQNFINADATDPRTTPPSIPMIRRAPPSPPASRRPRPLRPMP